MLNLRKPKRKVKRTLKPSQDNKHWDENTRNKLQKKKKTQETFLNETMD